jgi:hypothetical protein
MALNKKFFPKVSAAAADTFTPSEHFNTVLYTGTGASQRIGGYINRGAVFNGSSSVITLPNKIEDPIISSAAFGITGWFQTDTVSSRQGIISLLQDMYLIIEITSSGTLKGIVSNSSGTNTEITGTTSLSTNTWYHFAFTGDSDKIELFLDNSSEGSSTAWNGTWYASSNVTPKIGTIGSNYMNGTLDQIRIFDKELSSSERTTLYGETHSSTTISTTDIFNDNSGVALYQLDGNADDTGGASGRLAGTESAIFSNSDSNFNLGTATVIDNNFGISFWVKVNNINSGSFANYIFAFMYGQNFQARVSSTGELRIDFGSISADCSFGTSHTFTEGVWYHIAITGTYTSSPGTVTVYVNGSSVGSGSNINGHNTSANYGNRIGSYHNATTPLDGQIEEFRIYKSTSLSTSDITALYSGTPPTTGLTNYFKFNGNDRNYASDRQLTPTNVIYAYDGTASNVTYQEATHFSPDLIWIQNRSSSGGYFNAVMDTIRGATAIISTNSTGAETTSYTQELTSFDSNGFTLGTGGGNYVNRSGDDYVSWCFNAGSGSSGSNTDGSITSTVKANTDAGFSIVKYTGNATDNATVGTGLSSAAELVIVKDLDNTQYWVVGGSVVGNGKTLYLNDTSGLLTRDRVKSVQSNTFTLGSHFESNGSGVDFISYCFHSVDDYQKIGTYDGTGASGNMVETGFEPAFLLVKRTSASGSSWAIFDNKRGVGEPSKVLYANISDSEYTDNANDVKFLSNGFMLLDNNEHSNYASNTYIYLAIAADPDTTTPTVENSFDVVAYTGNGSTQDIEVDFKPDLVWIKQRTGSAAHHLIFDSVRGAYKTIFPSSTSSTVDRTSVDKGVTSFDSNGFTVKDTSAGDYEINGSNGGTYSGDGTYIAWCFKAGSHDDNLPEINTEGTIDSTVSVNDAAGFSIVKYDGTGTAGSYGHGLSSAPEMIITKNIDWSTPDWFVYHKDLGTNGYLRLSKTTAEQTASTLWSSAPSATVVNIGNDSGINRSNGDTQIAYCWYSVTGHSKIGSYSGNQTLNTPNQINFGFTPRFVMIKNSTNSGSQWMIFDSTRTNGYALYANSSTNEVNYSTDLLLSSQGLEFKSTNINVNQSGATYIYLAIK